MYKLPEVNISGVELSDLFFNYIVKEGQNVEQSAMDFLEKIPSLKGQGITVRMLVNEYWERL